MTTPINKTYPALDAEDVAKKMEKRGRWKSLLGGALAGLATRQSTAVVTDNSGNRADVTFTEREDKAIDNARRQRESQSKVITVRQQN